jgi:hypothetical protein
MSVSTTTDIGNSCLYDIWKFVIQGNGVTLEEIVTVYHYSLYQQVVFVRRSECNVSLTQIIVASPGDLSSLGLELR